MIFQFLFKNLMNQNPKRFEIFISFQIKIADIIENKLTLLTTNKMQHIKYLNY
jgi:hypothetical protein